MLINETTSDIQYLSAEIDRCNALLIGNLPIAGRLDLLAYRRQLHARLLGDD